MEKQRNELREYEGGKVTKKKREKPDPNRIKKPFSAYTLFCMDFRKSHSSIPNMEIMRHMGDRWKEMTEEEKNIYKRNAELAKDKYNELVVQRQQEVASASSSSSSSSSSAAGIVGHKGANESSNSSSNDSSEDDSSEDEDMEAKNMVTYPAKHVPAASAIPVKIAAPVAPAPVASKPVATKKVKNEAAESDHKKHKKKKREEEASIAHTAVLPEAEGEKKKVRFYKLYFNKYTLFAILVLYLKIHHIVLTIFSTLHIIKFRRRSLHTKMLRR